MPGGVVANNDIPWPFEFYILVGMVQKHLKDFAVAMGEFQGIKQAGPGTNQAGNVHAPRNRARESWPLSAGDNHGILPPSNGVARLILAVR